MNNLFIVISFLIPFFGFSQNMKIYPSPEATPHHLVQEKKMPHQNNENLYLEEMRQRVKGRPDHFATPIEVNIDITREGTWSVGKNGMAICKYKIVSEGAHSINLGFSNYALAESANLLIYNIEETDIKGPFTVRSSGSYDQLWTPVIQGDEIIIELQVPQEDRSGNILTLSYVNHDFIGFLGSRASGSCNVDVNCGEADGYPQVDQYRDIIASVGAYHLNGIAMCSGALINNTDNDCTPYFLTANHCGIRNSNAATMVVYWNYENSYCREPWGTESGRAGDGKLDDYNTGAILRASNAQTDFTLVELTEPLKTSSKLFAAGFKAEFGLTNTSIAIHHPNVEEKRISFDFDDPTYADDNNYIRIDNWDIGTTEGGSSGSPLFNTEGQIIGQLYGGYAACGNQEWDIYGTLAVSWEGGGTSSTRLKDWLDKSNTGVKNIYGKNCGNSITTVNTIPDICLERDTSFSIDFFISGELTDSIYLSLSTEDNLSYTFSKNPILPSDTVTLTIFDLQLLPTGRYPFAIIATDSIFEIENIYSFNIFENIPVSAAGIYPIADTSNVITPVPLSWSGNALAYTIEIARDDLFEDIIYSTSDVKTTNITINELEYLTKYYWRIKGLNTCGESEWSDTYSFITTYPDCSIAGINDTVVDIASTPTVITSAITIEETGLVTGIKIRNVTGTHTYISDLTFSLVSPSGKSVILVDRACDNQRNFNFSVDEDNGTNLVCPLSRAQVIKTNNGALRNFIGDEIQGTWTLVIEDHENFDGGQLQSWGIEICSQSKGILFTISKESDEVCSPDTIYNSISIANNTKDTVLITPVLNTDDLEFNIDIDQVRPFTSIEIPFSVNNISLYSENTETIELLLTTKTDTVSIDFNYHFNPVPATGNNISPENGASDVELEPVFRWEEGEFTESYRFVLQVVGDNEDSIVVDTILTENQYNLSASLEHSTPYNWYVTYINDCDSITNESSSFTTLVINSSRSNYNTMLEVRPNPVFNILQIREIENNHISTIEIISVAGNTVYKNEKYPARSIDIDISHLTSGIYLLRVSNETSTTIHKVVKK